MHTTRYFTLALLLSCFTPLLIAQSYPGLNVDNYAGVHGVLLNPANLGSTRTNTELNLASVAATLSNDYASLNGSDLRQALDDDDFGAAIVNRFPGRPNNVYASADAVGPSLLIRLGERSGLALLTRARAAFTIEGINGHLLESFYAGFDQLADFSFAADDYQSTLHTWGEAALAFGTTVVNHPNHRVKIGLSLKYLQGLGAVYSTGNSFSGSYSRQQERLDVGGEISFGRTDDFYVDELTPANRTAGFGLDAGLVYEWHPGSTADDYRDRYRLKVAVSLVDMGSIDYTATTTDYLLSGSLPIAELEDDNDLEYVLDTNFDGDSRPEDATIGLPSALHALLDVRLTGKLYFSGLLTTSARASDATRSNRVPTSLTVAPRIEGRGFGLSLPYTLRPDGDNHLGAGLRLGILTVGSGSLVSHFLGDGNSTVDVFVGLKLPFHRKPPKNKGAAAGAVPPSE